MKYSIFRITLLTALVILIVFSSMPLRVKNTTKIFTLPALPQPIAEAPAVITSAGQGTDTYIIRDIANQMMIRSYFMPQASDTDLKDTNTLVFAVGYSSMGTKLQNMSYEEEKVRVEKLLKKAEDSKMTILTIAIGGEYTHDNKTEELLRLVGSHTDYFIGIRQSSNEGLLTELAKAGDVPLTLVEEVKDISGPFASAFR